MTHDDQTRIAAIQAREQAATAGPWIRRDDAEAGNQPRVAGPTKANGKRDVLALFPFGFKAGVVESNADFIANSRTDIPWLLAALARLQAENAKLQGEHDRLIAETTLQYERAECLQAENQELKTTNDALSRQSSPCPSSATGSPRSPQPEGSEHELKTWPDYYKYLMDGTKTFEYRRDDRGFKVGDVLYLREWEPTFGNYTGREMRRRVTYLLNVSKDFVVMALESAGSPPRGFTPSEKGKAIGSARERQLEALVVRLQAERDEARRTLNANAAAAVLENERANAAEAARDGTCRTLAQVGTWHANCRPNREMAARELAKSQAVIDKLADRISELEAARDEAQRALKEVVRHQLVDGEVARAMAGIVSLGIAPIDLDCITQEEDAAVRRLLTAIVQAHPMAYELDAQPNKTNELAEAQRQTAALRAALEQIVDCAMLVRCEGCVKTAAQALAAGTETP